MRASIEHDGQVRTVDVLRTPAGAFHVVVDGHLLDIDVCRLDGGEFSLRLADGSTHRVRVERGAGRHDRVVAVDGVRVETAINGRNAGARDRAGTGDGPQRLLAPMPGRVVRVLVAVGQEVAARAPLVVVEAMKMENELSASRAGTVVDVRVAEGESVEAGRLLVTVE